MKKQCLSITAKEKQCHNNASTKSGQNQLFCWMHQKNSVKYVDQPSKKIPEESIQTNEPSKKIPEESIQINETSKNIPEESIQINEPSKNIPDQEIQNNEPIKNKAEEIMVDTYDNYKIYYKFSELLISNKIGQEKGKFKFNFDSIRLQEKKCEFSKEKEIMCEITAKILEKQIFAGKYVKLVFPKLVNPIEKKGSFTFSKKESHSLLIGNTFKQLFQAIISWVGVMYNEIRKIDINRFKDIYWIEYNGIDRVINAKTGEVEYSLRFDQNSKLYESE